MKYSISSQNNLERLSITAKFLRLFFIPIMNSLPAFMLRGMMKKSSKDANTVVNNGGSTHALEAMYMRHQRGLFSRGLLQGIADYFWHHVLAQPMAIRNRLKIVESMMETELSSRLATNKPITILNLGGGSSRGIIHSLNRVMHSHPKISVKIINIDKDARAIELGKEISRAFHLENNFQWINDDVRNLSNLISPLSADIVEMVGLLDYFHEERGIDIFKQIYHILKPGGLFIVANVNPNSEMNFVSKVWPKMYYKTPDEMENMIRVGGFIQTPEILLEPLRVHIVASVRK